MVAGRPKKYDLLEEAKALDQWSQKEDSFSLYEFTDLKDYCASDLSCFAKECEEFRISLKKSKERISIRRERAVNKNAFNYGIWNRNARVYDSLLKQSEDQDADKEAERKKDIASSNPSQIIVVSNDKLASGINLPAERLSDPSNQSTQ